MPANRKSSKNTRRTGTGSPARAGRPADESVELAAPIVLPGDDTPTAQPPAAPKAGPPIRNGGGPGGVGRGRGAASSRRYAFRRS
ncbi:hypothetical protein GCM10022225_70930 [Plantactinospora mayteni]|uniref:Uncharacterized protein n=1 Tax=Plantactinospora mayteni TaxID=566021 RepID=A0ABQ4EVR3_9ACTN|nr:hypothetical protein [Plantactinospora mayteni]GIG98767.1 hypothetical protein Pma05_53400 [Plantactinospora mayteni]